MDFIFNIHLEQREKAFKSLSWSWCCSHWSIKGLFF